MQVQGDNGRKSRSLKNTLIDPFSQLKLGVYVVVLSVVFLCVAGWLFYQSFVAQYQHVLEIFQITDPDTQWETITSDVFYSNLLWVGLVFALYIVLLLALVLHMTHKYHGPLVSIERFAIALSEGKYYSRVSVRKKDELKSLIQKLNDMAQQLECKHGSLVDAEGQAMSRRKADRSLASTDADSTGDENDEAQDAQTQQQQQNQTVEKECAVL